MDPIDLVNSVVKDKEDQLPVKVGSVTITEEMASNIDKNDLAVVLNKKDIDSFYKDKIDFAKFASFVKETNSDTIEKLEELFRLIL